MDEGVPINPEVEKLLVVAAKNLRDMAGESKDGHVCPRHANQKFYLIPEMTPDGLVLSCAKCDHKVDAESSPPETR